MTDTVHISVLLEEVLEGLNIKPGDIILDATLGGGGHTAEICEKLGKDIVLIGIDADKDAIDRANSRIDKFDCETHFVESNFRKIDTVLKELNIPKVDKVLFDLGLSSDELESSGRGFTFLKDEPLLMTFKKDPGEGDVTAKVIVNEWGEENIADILYGFGEERLSRKIAKGIIEARKEKSIETTFQLVEIIKNSVPGKYLRQKIHPATKTFQALRIAVNDELGAIEEGIEKSFEALNQGGRIAIISFHSIEDRLVKRAFKKLQVEERAKLIVKKPITPGSEEVSTNPRARSAKLRIIEKI